MRPDFPAASPAPVAMTETPHPVSYELQQAAEAALRAAPSRDLFELLAVIVGICDALAESLADQPQYGELARVGAMAAGHAARLVEDLRIRRPESAEDDEGSAPAAIEPKVLIVEDDPDLLHLLTGAFVRAGFATFSARNGREGVKMLAQITPDLMVTDIVMPEMEGIGAILEAKRLSPQTRVIAMSGGGQYGRSGNFLEWAAELGADEVLAKPFRVSSLITAARLVLDRPPVQPPTAPTLSPSRAPPRLVVSR